jgi:adenylate kinase family enzyme
MQRVVILGPGGAGKSDLARVLAQRTGLPVEHLDVVFWKPGWTRGSREDDARDLAAAIAGDRWILDGDFLGVEGSEERFERVDTVIFLDVSRATCFRRVLKRALLDRGRSRSDLPAGCDEGFDLDLLRWIWGYPRRDRPRILGILSGLDGRVDVRHLRTRSDVQRYLGSLDARP